MKLEFTVRFAEITIRLNAGQHATPHDLAAMSDSVKAALAPHMAALGTRASALNLAAEIQQFKEGALNPRKSITARNQDARRFYDLTGEVLSIPDQPGITERLQQRAPRTAGAQSPSA